MDNLNVIEVLKIMDVSEVNKLLQFKDKDEIISYKLLDIFHTGTPDATEVFIVGKIENSVAKFKKDIEYDNSSTPKNE